MSTPTTSLPDFSSIKSSTEKKKQFFALLEPIATIENQRLLSIRNAALKLKLKSHIRALTDKEQAWLTTLAKRFQITDSTNTDVFWQHIEQRVDTVPMSLVLAQAALESAWGTSRFAQKANNLFGQWCYIKGCGLVPLQRMEGAVHEVQKFSSINHSVRAYLLNLNRNKVYKKLRTLRSQLHKQHKPITGIALAEGLSNYSERGMAYVSSIQAVISHNKLFVYDFNSDTKASLPEKS